MSDIARAVIVTQTPTGAAVVIEVKGKSDIDTIAVAKIGGKEIALRIHSIGITYKMGKPREGVTHFLSSWNGKTGIGLTAEEAKRVDAEWKEFKRARDDLPEERKSRLKEHRHMLSLGIRGALDDVAYRREREYTRDIGIFARYDTDKAVLAAQKVLRDFDAEHPEIIEELNREREESRVRHQWD